MPIVDAAEAHASLSEQDAAELSGQRGGTTMGYINDSLAEEDAAHALQGSKWGGTT